MSKKGQIYKKRSWQERFWKKVDKNGHNGCWEWTGYYQQHNGYGCFKYKDRIYKAHNVIGKETFGEIPQGMYVCHRCDNPRCVNPEHLFLGTHQDNMNDKKKKGRGLGSFIHLTYNQNYRLKRLCKNNNFTYQKLSIMFNIHPEVITQFKRRLKEDKNLYLDRKKNCINNLSYQQICNRYNVTYSKLHYQVKYKNLTKEKALNSILSKM